MNEKCNLESISLIWLDSNANLTEENRQTQDKLRSIISHLKIFDNCQLCLNFFQQNVDQEQDRFILIVSGQLGQEIIEQVHEISQIISIFVFCLNKDKNELWAKNYKKVFLFLNIFVCLFFVLI